VAGRDGPRLAGDVEQAVEASQGDSRGSPAAGGAAGDLRDRRPAPRSEPLGRCLRRFEWDRDRLGDRDRDRIRTGNGARRPAPGARRPALGVRRSALGAQALGARRSGAQALGARRSASGARRPARGARRSPLGLRRPAFGVDRLARPARVVARRTVGHDNQDTTREQGPIHAKDAQTNILSRHARFLGAARRGRAAVRTRASSSDLPSATVSRRPPASDTCVGPLDRCRDSRRATSRQAWMARLIR
jgi:hypothetical protein